MYRQKLDPQFKPLLRSYNVTALRTHAGAIYGVWENFAFAYFNAAWFKFAAENGGEPAISERWPLGASLLDGMSARLAEFYAAKYRTCLKSGIVWHHEYECSSDGLYRRFHQTVHPLAAGCGLLVMNSLVIERPHDAAERPPHAADESAYRDAQGFLRQCAHCRRVKHVKLIERWDWVPQWVRSVPADTTHGFCPMCFGHYYPEASGSLRKTKLE